MKKTVSTLFLPVVFALAGCQQFNDTTGKLNSSINSSLSSLNSMFSPSGNESNKSMAESLPVNTVGGLGSICHDYESNAMAGKKNWIGKKISISNATVLEAQEAYNNMKYLGVKEEHKTYAILFKTNDTNYCAGAIQLTYYAGLDNDILKYKKGQRINISGVIYDIGDRTFYTKNNENMAWKIIKLKDGVVR